MEPGKKAKIKKQAETTDSLLTLDRRRYLFVPRDRVCNQLFQPTRRRFVPEPVFDSTIALINLVTASLLLVVFRSMIRFPARDSGCGR
jgi:hypothetical protein